jgi:hypothetical protein
MSCVQISEQRGRRETTTTEVEHEVHQRIELSLTEPNLHDTLNDDLSDRRVTDINSTRCN